MESDLEATHEGRARIGCEFQGGFLSRRAHLYCAPWLTLVILVVGCAGADDLSQIQKTSEPVQGQPRQTRIPKIVHHLPSAALDALAIPKVDAEAGRFVAQASSGDPAVVRVGELLGVSKARVKAIYKERIMLDEPLAGSTGLRTASVVIELKEAGKPKVFRIRPLTEQEINSDGLPPTPVIKMQKMPKPQDTPENTMGK